MAEQFCLVVAGPGHVTIRPQQHGGHVQFLAGVDDVVDPVGPALHREPAGLVQQQSAAAVHQLVEAAPRQAEVAHPPAEQLWPVAEVVADAGGGDLLGQVPVHVLEVHQLRHQPAHRLRARLERDQLHLRAGVVQHVGGDRVPLGLVAVQQPLRRPAVDLGGQFPAQVDRILDAEVESLPADRRVDVRRVAGEQHPADPVALGQPGGVAEPGGPARRVRAEVGAGELAHLLLNSSRVGGTARSSATPSAGAPSRYTPSPSGTAPNRSWVFRTSATTEAIVLRRGGQLHLGQQRVDPAGSPGKPTPSSLRTVLRPPSQPTR